MIVGIIRYNFNKNQISHEFVPEPVQECLAN